MTMAMAISGHHVRDMDQFQKEYWNRQALMADDLPCFTDDDRMRKNDVSARCRKFARDDGNVPLIRLEEVIISNRQFTVTMEQDPEDGRWVGLVKELPGCGSQGGTLEELREMVKDAIHEYLIARGDIADDAQAD